VRLQPEDPEAHAGLAEGLDVKGDRAGALAEYREAVRLNPGYARAYVGLSHAHLWDRE
jgi:Flp pilus assembly protein TadD